MIDIKTLTIKSAHEALKKGEFKVADLFDAYKLEAQKVNPEINAYLEFFDESDAIQNAQKRYDEGTAGTLTGMPFAMKDNILIKGHIASASSKMLENYIATYDSTVTKRLREAGALFLGRTNMDEFAMGGSTENSAFGPTKNPYDTSRVPGGSSGGSAAAVAMNGSIAAMGTDTGGSIREPASFCGLVGFKPTYGAVSRHGLIAMGSSLDQVGPLTKTVTDAEIIFNTIRGKDGFDSTAIDDGFYPKKEWKGKKPTIGVPRAIINTKGVDADVIKNIDESIEKFKKLGYDVVDIELPNIGYSLAVYYVLMPAEVSSNLARFDGIKYGLSVPGKDLIDGYFKSRGAGFGKEVRRRIILGTYVLSAGYADAFYYKAQALRKLIADDFTKAWGKVDMILTPTAPSPAFKIGEKVNDPVSMYLADIFTVTANIVGVPGLALPSGFLVRDGKDLPAGIQLMAGLGQEHTLFSAGKDFLGEVQ